MKTILGFVLISMLISVAATAGTNKLLVYSGRIISPSGEPLQASNVQFTISIYTPGAESCLLYAETQNLNMTGSLGAFSLRIGEGSGTGGYLASQMEVVFQNDSAFTGLTCANGDTTYDPTAHVNNTDRILRITFNDGSGSGTIALAAQNIKSVPYALQARNSSRAVDVTGTANISSLILRNASNNQINITAPASAFTNYSLVLPDSNGGVGDILTTDGNGVLSWMPAASVGSGTVTSVGVAVPAYMTTSADITTAGDITIGFANQAAGTVFAAPSGVVGAPSFRALTGTDIPDLSGTYLRPGDVVATTPLTWTAGTKTMAIDLTNIQARVTGTCAAGSSIRTINADGTVVCETDDVGAAPSDAAYSPGNKGIVAFDTSEAVSGITVAAGIARLADTITAGTAGSATSVPVITFDKFGRLTTVTSATIVGGGDVSGDVNNLTVNKIRGKDVTGALAADSILWYDQSADDFTATALPTCAPNHYLTFNGTAWSCEADAGASGTVASVTVAAPLSQNATSGAVTMALDYDATKFALNAGDLTLAANSVGATELASTTVTPAAYGSASSVASFTVDADGRLTAASAIPIALTPSAVSLVGNANRIATYDGSGVLTAATALTNGQILIGSTGAAPVAATITAGTGITVNNTAGGIEIVNNVAAPTGGNNHVAIYNGSGGLTSEASLAVSRGGTGSTTFAANQLVYTGLTGTAFAPFFCPDGQVIKFTAGVIGCANDETGAAPSDAAYSPGNKGIVAFDTSEAVSGITVAAGIARLADTITAGTAGSATSVPVITFDKFGRLTTVTSATIVGGGDVSGDVNNLTVNKIRGKDVTGALAADSILWYDQSADDFTATALPTCAANHYLTFNGTAWSCEADAGASGTVATVTVSAPLSQNATSGTVTIDLDYDATKFALNAGDLTLAANSVGATELASTTVTPAAYGTASSVASFTVDADGRLTAASAIPIALAPSAISLVGNANRIATYDGSGVLTAASALTNGQILIGSTGAAPAAATITAGGGVTVTNGAGSITLGSDNTVIQARVSGTCAAGSSIRTINVDGTVVCETDDVGAAPSDAGYSPGNKGIVAFDTSEAVSGITVAAGIARLADTITAGTAGSATSVPVITFDKFGRLTTVTSATIVGGGDVSGDVNNLTVNKIRGKDVTGALAADSILWYDQSADDFTATALPTCAPNHYLTFNGTAWSCEADAGASGTVASVTVSAPLSQNATSGTVTIDLDYDATKFALNAGDLTLAANSVGATELASTTVVPAAYGSASSVASFTVDADGRLTAASAIPIALAPSAVSLVGNANRIATYDGSGVLTAATALTNGQILIGSTGAAPAAASLTAGAGITITPGAGSISIASSLAGMPTCTIDQMPIHTGAAWTCIDASSNTGNSTIIRRDASGDFFARDIGVRNIASTGNISFRDGDTNTATIQAPTDITTSYVLKLPAALPGSPMFLQSNATGDLSWAAAGGMGGSGTIGRIPRFTATGAIGDSAFAMGSTGDLVFTGTDPKILFASDLMIHASGTNSVALGKNALYWGWDSPGNNARNVAIGADSMGDSYNISNSVAVGFSSLKAAGGDGGNQANANTAIGAWVMDTLNGVGAHNNTAIGGGTSTNNGVLTRLTTGANNTALGFGAGAFANTTSSGNVLLGNQSGPTAATVISNKLYIDNSANDTPLIGGDFTANTVDINGSLNIAFAGGYLNYKPNNTECTNGDTLIWNATTDQWLCGTPGGGGVTGTGTAGRIPKFTAASVVGDSLIGENATAANRELTLGGTRVLSTRGTNSLFLGNAGNNTFTTGTAVNNIGIGNGTLDALTLGVGNIGIGTDSATSMTDSYGNISMGHESLYSATMSDYNIAIGVENMRQMAGTGSDGRYNVSIGYQAMRDIVEGSENVAIGYGALNGNYVSRRTSNSTVVGARALPTSNAGLYAGNDAFGAQAMTSATTAYDNTGIGYRALYSVTTGLSNVSLGREAGYNANGASTGNVFIGRSAGPTAAGPINNSLYIHNAASNTPLIYGDFGTPAVTINGTLTATGNVTAPAYLYTSDRRLKTDIVTSEGLETVLNLRGVRFNWIKSGQPEVGLIAQEVEEIYPELVHTDENGMKSVKYGNLVAPLIQSTKELYGMSKMSEAQMQKIAAQVSKNTRKIASLEEENTVLKNQVKTLEQKVKSLESLEERLRKLEQKVK